jgi:hypothetical protein
MPRAVPWRSGEDTRQRRAAGGQRVGRIFERPPLRAPADSGKGFEPPDPPDLQMNVDETKHLTLAGIRNRMSGVLSG